MTKIKSLFSTPLKAVVTCVCIVAILALIGTVTAAAVGAIAKGNAIGAEQAQNYAFADAGVDPAAAMVEKTEFDYEMGHFVYEIEFYANGVEYEYTVKSDDGTILKRKSEGQPQITTNDNSATTTTASGSVTLDEAKAIALADAGLAESDVSITKTKTEYDDGREIHEIDFVTADTKYEYEIVAADGSIYSKSKETFAATSPTVTTSPSDTQQAANVDMTLDEAKTIALSDAGLSASDVTFTKGHLDYDDGVAVYELEFYTSDKEYDYDILVSDGRIISRDIEARRTAAQQPAQTASDATITLDEAKTIALLDAGLSASDVTFTKDRLDYDDGMAVYELEFYTSTTEYDYDVSATSGNIISRESEAFRTGSQSGTQTTTSGTDVTLDEAKAIALSDAGLSESSVTFTKTKLDYDDGIKVYDIEFYTSDREYEYEINASTGKVVSRSSEAFRTGSQSGTQTTTSGTDVTLDEAKAIALADAGVSSSEVTYKKAKLDYDDGIKVYDIEFYTSSREYEYEINASTGKIVSRSSEAFRVDTGNVGNASFIGVDKAKTIAADHAGVSASSVTFSKAKLENDDGMQVYEIEFYYNGMEYEYTISATTGDIIEYDYDR